ncbi:MAG: protein-disulfide reductase DsbD domain-containing protein [Pseudomonadota bacterium]
MEIRPIPAALTALALSFGLNAPASAQFLGRSADEVVEVTLMEGWRLSDTRHMAAIRIQLAPGWKTYWRAPGEGGVPTVLRIDDAEGITGMAIHWPRPEVFFTNGLRSIGYRDDVILPVEFAVDADGAVAVEGHVDLGVCLDVCMPVSLDLAALLPATTDRVPEISAALSNQPFTAVEAGAGPATCTVEPISDGLRVTITAEVPPVGNDETVVMEHRDPMIWVSEAMTNRQGARVTAVADVVPADAGPFALNRSDLRVTVIGTQMAVELDSCTG